MSYKYRIAQVGAKKDKNNSFSLCDGFPGAEVTLFVIPGEDIAVNEKALVYPVNAFAKLHNENPFDFIIIGESVVDAENGKKVFELISRLGVTQDDDDTLDLVCELNKTIADLQDQIKEYRNDARSYKQMADEFRLQAVQATAMYNEIKNAFYWRVLSPIRFVTNKIKLALYNCSVTRKFFKGIKLVIKNGPVNAYKIIKESKNTQKAINKRLSIEISDEQREKEENTVFDKNIKFSILVPLYNTPLNFLKEMIDSVITQTYPNWELCLADGSSAEFEYVEKYCTKLAKKDKRIVYKKLEKNGGISENTNECIRMATGDYIALFDHDDVLHPSVLFENMRAICEQGADYIYTDETTFLGDKVTDIVSYHLKADFAFYSLLANNYICHFSVFKRDLIDKAGMFRKEYDGSQDHDFILRITDVAQKIVHIPRVLYFWRSHKNSVAMDINSKTYAIKAGQNAVRDFLKSKGINAKIESSPAFPTIYKANIELKDKPLVSIIIPTRNHGMDLQRCINSIRLQSTYDNYEIIVVDNQTTDKYTLQCFKALELYRNVKVLKYDNEFNYSAINNFAAKHSKGEYLLFLNNDTEIITPEWIEELLMYAQLPDVGAVGAKLYFDDNTVQHGGIILGMGDDGVAGHSHYRADRNNVGYMGRMYYVQNLSAVTAACMMISKKVFDEVDGFSEDMPVAFNDVDLCLKLRQKDYNVLFNPFCELYHYESKSRGLDTDKQKVERFKQDVENFKTKWKKELQAGDPFFNPNFNPLCPYFQIRED